MTGGSSAILWDRLRHQDRASAALREAWKRGRTAHAVLIWGPEGVGKTRAAHAFAQQLLCAGDPVPCGSCVPCGQTARFTHPDIHVVLPGRVEDDTHQKALEAFGSDPYHCWEIPANATIGIERIRALKAEASKARVGTGNRVAIIRDAERMTPEAAQAALKLIEEPQDGTYLILTCQDPKQLLPTILSRCQRIRLRPLPRSFLGEVLSDQGEAAQGAVDLVSSLAQGSLGQALRLLDEDVAALRDLALNLFDAPLSDVGAVRDKVRPLERPPGKHWNPERARTVVDLMMRWYEDLLLVRSGLSDDAVANRDRLEQVRTQARQVSVEELKRRIGILEEMVAAIRQNVNPMLSLQTALLRLNGLAETNDI